MSRLVVVSNRVAIPDTGARKRAAAGGLAVALQAALKASGGLWFGWSGKVNRHPSTEPTLIEAEGVSYATVDITPNERREYYNGFANRALWPLFHYRTDLTAYEQEFYEGYSRVNAQFAHRLSKLLKPDDTIWVHDYHLIPLAKLLRRAGCRQRMGFFLHIPFPARQVLLTLPHHKALVRALFSYDLVGFQTEEDLLGFSDYVRREAGGTEPGGGIFHAYGQTTQAGAFPISLDTDNVIEMSAGETAKKQYERTRRSLDGRRMIIGVDRLDYSKGLGERMRAFDSLLENYPEYRNAVSLMQVAPSSRDSVPEYRAIRDELEQIVGRINGRYAEPEWVPIRYIGRSFARDALVGLYRAAKVGLVTPFRDGMNLVAMEYVASQDPTDPGALVLSRFAGAAHQLPGAIIVNPYDIRQVAEGLHRALEMSHAERLSRWRDNMDRLTTYDVKAWRSNFMNTLMARALAA